MIDKVTIDWTGNSYLLLSHSSTTNSYFSFIIGSNNYTFPLYCKGSLEPPYQLVEYKLGRIPNGIHQYELEVPHDIKSKVAIASLEIVSEEGLAQPTVNIEATLPPQPRPDPNGSPIYNNSYLVIPNYAAGWGGFWYVMARLAEDITLARQYGLTPVPDIRGGLYASNKLCDPESIRSTPWVSDYYFDLGVPPVDTPTRDDLTLHCSKHPFKLTGRRRQTQLVEIPRDGCYLLDWSARTRYARKIQGPVAYREILRPHRYIVDYLDQFWQSHQSHWHNHVLVGIHYRGTDKVSSDVCDEDEPSHPSYEAILQGVVDQVTVQTGKTAESICLLLASDEQQFIDYCCRHHPYTVAFDWAFRSGNCTGNLQLKRANMDLVRELRDESIHFGHTNYSNFEKGLSAVLDVLLLSKSDYLFISKGNFSQAATWYLQPGSKYYFLADVAKC